MSFSANEIEGLILKAARGGKLPTGLCEDLAAASAYLELSRLDRCPCIDGGAAWRLPAALDRVAAGQGPQTVTADAALIEAYVALAERLWQKRLVWRATPDGAEFDHFAKSPPPEHRPLGRRDIPAPLLEHLLEMAEQMLVPETEASRAGGAGAGLTDND